MARGKVHLKRIQNPVNRRVTFSKRKGGLLKKAKEISVLCEAEIGLIIFSPTGKLFEFASPRSSRRTLRTHCSESFSDDCISFMSRIMGKYQKLGDSLGHNKLSSEYLEVLGLEVENLDKRLTHLEKMYKHMKGEDLDLLNFKNLKCLEKKMSLGARKIHSKKDKISIEYVRSLKIKEKSLKLENAELDEKEKSLELENAVLNKKIGKSQKARHLNIDIMEEINDKLETDAATQQDLPQTNLNLTLS